MRHKNDSINCFLLLEQRASACTLDHLFVRLPSLCSGVCLLCTRPYRSFSSYCLCRGHSYLSFEMYSNILRAEAPFLVIKISNKKSPQRWRFSLLWNESKRHKPSDTSRGHPRNARIISAEELGPISKYNFRGITLGARIRSSTLIISWLTLIPWIKKSVSNDSRGDLWFGISLLKDLLVA